MVDTAVSCNRKARAGTNLRGDVHLYRHTYVYICTHTNVWASLVAQMVKNPPAMQEICV